MLVKEAVKINEIIKNLNIKSDCVVLNIGSQNKRYLSNNPHILKHVLNPIINSGAKLINFDLLPGDGIDIYGDIFDIKVYQKLKNLNCNLIILTNVLEHVNDINIFVHQIESLLNSGCRIIFSGPYKFPTHLDPIDNLFRPKPEDLIPIFKQCKLECAWIVKDINYLQKITLNFSTFVNEMIRILTPFYKFKKWRTIVVPKWKWLFKSFEVTVALLVKK